MSETTNKTVIPIRRVGATMQVAKIERVNGRLLVRVLVHGPRGDTTPLPMRVLLPARCVPPSVGGVVVFDGLRVELHEANDRVRPIVRADRVQEVAVDAAA